MPEQRKRDMTTYDTRYKERPVPEIDHLTMLPKIKGRSIKTRPFPTLVGAFVSESCQG